MPTLRTWIVAALAITLAACGDDDALTVDASADASAAVDAAPDATPDAAPDATPDGGEPDDIVIVVDHDALTIIEGRSGDVAVTLSARPAAAVTVTATPSSAAIVPAPTALVFQPDAWDHPQVIAVMASPDDDSDDGAATLTLSAPGQPSRAVAVTIDDDDDTAAQAIVVSATTVQLAEGSSAAVQVHLAAAVDVPTTVTLASSTPDALTVSPGTLTFTGANWNVDKPITLEARQDADNSNELVTVHLTSPGIDEATVNATITDDEAPVIQVPGGNIAVNEGASLSFPVRLSAAPAGAIVITVTSLNPAILGATPATLSFDPSNWDTAQPVTVNGLHDANTQDDVTQVKFTSPGLNTRSVSVLVHDLDH